MEVGAHVWLRSDTSQWGWVPAVIAGKESDTVRGVNVINLTLRDDPNLETTMPRSNSGVLDENPATPAGNWGRVPQPRRFDGVRTASGYYAEQEPFEVVLTVDPEQLKTADHDDIKLRNLPTSYQLSGEDPEAGVIASPSTKVDQTVVGGVDDLIGLTHLHEPAILHALRLRYDSDIIYTATGPILIAVNPFKPMSIYSDEMMEKYRIQGENGTGSSPRVAITPFKRGKQRNTSMRSTRLPPHAYQTADDAYRAMMRGLENSALMNRSSITQGKRQLKRGESITVALAFDTPADQSILVSGESGAGKTVTTKIVLNYFAMLSKKRAEMGTPRKQMLSPTSSLHSSAHSSSHSTREDDVSIEQQVLQSNPILESFGNARTIRNDNSSRFGKYIDIRFTPSGKLSGASIETYLLEKVRLIHPSTGERNYHVFYQFLSSATRTEREQFFLGNLTMQDFKMLNTTGTYDRRDGVSDVDNHQEMLDAMITIGFAADTIQSLMRLVVAVLFAGNMTFTSCNHDGHDGESCTLDETDAAIAAASLLGVSFEGLAAALTSRTIFAGSEVVHKALSMEQSIKACEALIKACYGAAFDYVVERVNESIVDDSGRHGQGAASIGLLDIFGFETFEVNNFEQICINYTNEALQQQFNKYVFKLEQQEYEREGILWKFIAFPDNQDVLDLIDKKHTGILSLLDEQCIVPKSTDQKMTRYLYSKCDRHMRFSASSAQRVDYKFSIEHYAGFVEYTTDSWLEKNKDQLPAASSELLASSSFGLIGDIRRFVRTEERNGRGTVATKSVGHQFSTQLRSLRSRIDTTVPHYIRCLKPNDDLNPDHFEPRNIVEQLRCGGVLEAVRVSRAGYPTRYPHDVFMARYYILADREDDTPQSPFAADMVRMSANESSLKRLISKIAFDVWYADHQMIMSLLEQEKLRSEVMSPKYVQKQSLSPLPKKNMSHNMAGPVSLAVESSVMTPEEKKLKKLKKGRLSTSSIIREMDKSKVQRPESELEFLSLDFSQRCAVAGLQLGRTKVFLRREAFDRIEALRSDKFFDAATSIQKVVRGKLCRLFFLDMKYAAITVQSAIRMMLATARTRRMKLDSAVTKIQSIWRMVSTKYSVWKCYVEMKHAVVVIQRTYRRYRDRSAGLLELQVPAATKIQAAARGRRSRVSFLKAAHGTTTLQSVYRGKKARETVVADARNEANERKARLSAEEAVAATAMAAAEVARVASESTENEQREMTPAKIEREVQNVQPVVPFDSAVVESNQTELYRHIQDEHWAMVQSIMDKNPELAGEVEPSSGELPLHIIARHSGAWTLLVDMVLVLFPKALIHRDRMGALPIHHAAAHDNLAALEIIYSAYKEGINDIDLKGRLPIHVAAEFDAVDAVKFLLTKAPEGAYTMVHRPPNNSGGGLPLHIAARNYASIGVITALLAENFASAKRTDENGDLPLHLLLRCGEVVDQVVVKTMLTCFSSAVSRTDMHGDLPLSIALKHSCKPAVINTILMQFPEGAGILNGEGHSPLFLAFQHNADDRTILGLLNHAPELATAVDRETGLLPIQVATEHEHSHFIVHNLLKRDMPIDLKEKVRAQLLPHHYSWNHIVSNTDDMYHQVVNKLLQQCTQPQVLALAHVEGPDGKIALASASPVCKHELRVMLRLFNTLEVVNQRPAYTNPISDTQIFYALRYEPPANQSGAFTILHEDKKEENDYVEDWDDTSQMSGVSRNSIRSTITSRSQQSIEDKLRHIRKEKGQQVIAKLTSRSDVVERELKVRKDHHLSRHYVPAIISVHHTVQHAAYSEAMAEPGYCITMEGADTTAENLMLDLRKSGKAFPAKALKRIGISLLHMHEHGLVHGDFGTHNIGKFGSRWKLLGVGGSVSIGEPTDPNRGFYHPPEAVVVESKRASLGKKAISACVVSIPAQTTFDIWAYGVVLYEAIAGVPLSPYACRGKRAMSSIEIGKIGRWDEYSMKKALKYIDVEDETARDLIKKILHSDPEKRPSSMREVLEHPFFSSGSDDRKIMKKQKSGEDGASLRSSSSSRHSMSKHTGTASMKSSSTLHNSSLPKQPSGSSSVSTLTRQSSQPSAAPQIPGSRSMDSVHPKKNVSEGAPFDEENIVNGAARASTKKSGSASIQTHNDDNSVSNSTTQSKKSSKSFGGLRKMRSRMKSSSMRHS